MSIISDSLYEVGTHYDVRIPVRDGLELSANLYMPVRRAPDERFPAILEMIPYRKDDWHFSCDRQRMTYFAQRGHAGCRLDVRGTGSSPGLALDEYTEAETRDGYEAVEWLAAQPWCNGNVGMWGISYGGFNSIQVAMMQPPHLKAIIPGLHQCCPANAGAMGKRLTQSPDRPMGALAARHCLSRSEH
jgi:putative CocE/NonD family hydrolase